MENAPLRRLGLFSPRFQKGLPAPAVHRREPLFRIRNHWLQQQALRHPPHPHRISLEPKLPRQPHCLAAPVAKQFRHSALAHVGHLRSIVYTINLYHGSSAECRSLPRGFSNFLLTKRESQRTVFLGKSYAHPGNASIPAGVFAFWSLL